MQKIDNNLKPAILVFIRKSSHCKLTDEYPCAWVSGFLHHFVLAKFATSSIRVVEKSLEWYLTLPMLKLNSSKAQEQRFLKNIYTLSCWYLLDSSRWALSDKYQCARVSVIFQVFASFCIGIRVENSISRNTSVRWSIWIRLTVTWRSIFGYDAERIELGFLSIKRGSCLHHTSLRMDVKESTPVPWIL